jgi:hypothetical protein
VQQHQAFRQQAARHLQQLAQHDPQSAQQYLTVITERVQAEEQALQGELAQLRDASAAWAYRHQQMNNNANMKSLIADIPELADPQVQEDFVDRVHRRTGYTKAQIRSFGSGVSDPQQLEAVKSAIGAEWRQYQQETRAEREREFDRFIQKRSRDMGVNSRAGNQGVSGGEEGLLEYLRSGKATQRESQDAAVAYLMASRTRARERNRGNL